MLFTVVFVVAVTFFVTTFVAALVEAALCLVAGVADAETAAEEPGSAPRRHQSHHRADKVRGPELQ